MSENAKIHIGKLLYNHFYGHDVNKTKLAAKMGMQLQSLVKYKSKASMQSGLLMEVCYALEHNFFQDIANTMPQHFTVNDALARQNQNLIQQLQEENKVLKIQNEVLMKIRS